MNRECVKCGEAASSSTQEYCDACNEPLPPAYGGSPEATDAPRQAPSGTKGAVGNVLAHVVVGILIAAFAVWQLWLFSESRNKGSQETRREPLKRAKIGKAN